MSDDDILGLTDWIIGEFTEEDKIKEWGGGAFYTQKKPDPDNPISKGYCTARYCGFKTREAALKDILNDTFKGELGKVVLRLLRKAPKPRKKKCKTS